MAISKVGAPQGHVAEWLRNGLQNRVPRFNSGRGLQHLAPTPPPASPHGCGRWGVSVVEGLLTIVNFVIAALVAALTALGVSYFRTRGQNLATKHDFDELLRQLRTNTELVETIKSEVGQRD